MAGIFPPRLPLFEQRSDSAGAQYAAFRTRYNIGTGLSMVGLALFVGGLVVACTAVCQQHLRSILAFCNSPQMNAIEAYIQFEKGPHHR